VSVRLLLDENLSPRLVPLLASLYPGSSHVHAAGLSSASDLDIWNFAAANGLTIVTKDRDFQEFSLDLGHPPKVIAITAGNCSTRRVETMLRSQAIRISQFVAGDLRSLLIITDR
jgi:predicted nuclease of predicted toxin-antitoxin system